MREQEPAPDHRRQTAETAEADPFWTVDEPITAGDFHGHPLPIRLKAHLAEEPYRHFRGLEEIVPLASRSGTRTYVLARPYVAQPRLSITVVLFPRPRADGAIGRVVRSERADVREEIIGKAQGWYYHQDRCLVLWECFLHESYDQPDPQCNPTLHALWRGFEHFLLDRFPQAQQLVTPSWEPLYPAEQWQAFLGLMGYHPVDHRAFAKTIAPDTDEEDTPRPSPIDKDSQ